MKAKFHSVGDANWLRVSAPRLGVLRAPTDFRKLTSAVGVAMVARAQ